ncbi:MAG: AgmX/PglI C-terminal domain-containing protein, partial [Desulfobaccales bacterium]
SFVAVDKVKRGDGTMETVKQPLPLPEGVSDLAVGDGGSYAAKLAGLPRAFRPEVATTAPWGMGSAMRPPVPLPVKNEEKEKPLGLKVKVLKVQGKLEEAQVQQALEAKIEQVEACYRQARKAGTRLPQQVTLKISLGPDGAVTAVQVTNPKGQASSLTQCLAAALKQAAFPKPAEGKAEVDIQLTLPGPEGASG